MKSIQTKFIALILGCVLGSTTLIGGAGVLHAQRVLDKDSAQIMNLLCNEKAMEMNYIFSGIEQSVENLGAYAIRRLESTEAFQNFSYRKEYAEKLKDIAQNAVSHTEGATGVYIRFNPEIAGYEEGFFFSRKSNQTEFQEIEPTDIAAYAPTDLEWVGWYYIPVAQKEGMWMEPYLNRNIDVYMISYVVPLYVKDTLIGVVGMDIEFSGITDAVSEISLYQTGYAFLIDKEQNVLYHAVLPRGTNMLQEDSSLAPVVEALNKGDSEESLFYYNWQGEDKKMAFRRLQNGMRLVLTVPEREINAAKDGLILQIVFSTVLIAILAVILTVLLTRRMIKPLRQLNDAAKKIAAGDLGISLDWQTQDEVGDLARSFQMTVKHLQKYISYINGLAYQDALTGVKNKTAYQDMVRQKNEEIRIGSPDFAVVVFDLNGLKVANDTFGHDYGDMMIRSACKIICQIFKRSPVYRVGGDEFVALLENEDLRECAKLLEELGHTLQTHNAVSDEWGKVSVARGIAIFDENLDTEFNDVFKRADTAMYRNKAMEKSIGE